MKAAAKRPAPDRRKAPKPVPRSKSRRPIRARRASRYDRHIASIATETAPKNDAATPADPKGDSAAVGKPADWSKLVRGSRVLATDADSKGAWFAATVQSVDQSTVTLTWDGEWSTLGKFNRDVTQVALFHPSMKSAY